MSRPIIVLGDKTDHGGTVSSAAPTSLTGGKPMARIGDKVPCPKCNKPNAVIVSGDTTVIVDGSPVARHGDKTDCGATLIASQRPTSAG